MRTDLPSPLLALAMLIAPALAISAGEPEAVPDHAKELIGCWQGGREITGKDIFLFEPTKFTFVRDGHVEIVGRIRKFEPGKVTVSIYGRDTAFDYAAKDNGLAITMGQGKNAQMLVFNKLDKVPPEAELKPLALGRASPVDAERTTDIQVELRKRVTEDQAVRTNPARQRDMQKVDSDNTAYLRKLVGEIGWVDAARFGAETSNDAFLIVQHSGDLPLMSAALPEIEKDVKAKRLDAQAYALLYDRLHLMLGEKQRYGSQIGQNAKGEPVVLPLENRAKVEEYRRDIGLFPLSQYLGHFKRGGGDVKFADDE